MTIEKDETWFDWSLTGTKEIYKNVINDMVCIVCLNCVLSLGWQKQFDEITLFVIYTEFELSKETDWYNLLIYIIIQSVLLQIAMVYCNNFYFLSL